MMPYETYVENLIKFGLENNASVNPVSGMPYPNRDQSTKFFKKIGDT